MTFQEFRRVNRARCEAWHSVSSWSLSDWAVAMSGEVGEALNIIKKMNRIRDGIKGNKPGENYETLISKLGDELADSMTYMFLLAEAAEIDLEAALISKFNRVNERHRLLAFMLNVKDPK